MAVQQTTAEQVRAAAAEVGLALTDDDIKSYTIKDLKQLKELITQSYEHYAKMMADEKLTSSLKEGDLMALRMCHEETKKELDEIEQEIALRR